MNDHKESREITDPAELVKGRRYEAVDQDHPEYARSVGVFDGIRPDQEVGEDYVYFVNGQIGDVPQRIFGHPATQARCYREVGINALPASRRDAILKSPGLATIDAEGWGDIRGELDRGNWNGAAEIASQHANIQEAAMNQRAADEVWTLADLLVQEAKAEALLAAAPREGALIVVNARVQEVTRVDEDGGFYSCQEHSDGSGPTTHYWQAGTGWRPSTEYNLHPFGDEWLWDKTGDKGLTVALNEAVKVAEDHRAECMKGDDSQREFFAGMWFSVCEAESGELVALVSPSGKLLRGAEAMAWYACIGTDGEWPKPTSILIEWDGGSTAASSEEEVEAIITRKLEEWDAAGNAGERGDFLVRPNTSEAGS